MDERLREQRAKQAGWTRHPSGALVPPGFDTGGTQIKLVSSHRGKNWKPVPGSIETKNRPGEYDWPEQDLDELPVDKRIPAMQVAVSEDDVRWVSIPRHVRDAIRSGQLRIEGECDVRIVDNSIRIFCTDQDDARRLCAAVSSDASTVRSSELGWTFD